MDNNQKSQFAKILADTLGLYRLDLTKSLLELWWDDLGYFDIDAIKQAFSMHRRNPDNGQFAPKPADITRLIGGTSIDRAIGAWNKVRGAISSVGVYNSVVFDDVLIHAAIRDMGGWASICQGGGDELVFRQKDFENRYRTYLFNPPENYPKSLAGIAETENSAAGQPMDPPLTVGDIDQCRITYSGGISGARPLQMLNFRSSSNVVRINQNAV